MHAVKDLIHDFSRLFFPHNCAGCGSDVLEKEAPLCIRCIHALPTTHFHLYAGNPVEQQLTGRLPLVSGMAYCYYTRHALMQQVLHRFKYKGYRELGLLLGQMMGKVLLESGRFDGIEGLVPLPLHAAKERKRGYNQASVLCEGMASIMHTPVMQDAVVRLSDTASQTHKSRIERWQNMRAQFQLLRPEGIAGKHLLLVDDVITTGATLDACGQALLQAPGVRLSVAALAWADTNS